MLTCRFVCGVEERNAFESGLHLPEHKRLLHFSNGAGHVDAARAGLNAIKYGPAAPDSIHCFQSREPFRRPFIAAVKYESVGIDDGGWAAPSRKGQGAWRSWLTKAVTTSCGSGMMFGLPC